MPYFCHFWTPTTKSHCRVKRNTCRVAPEVSNLTRECAQHTNLVNEDEADYCNAWEESTELTRDLPSCQLPEFKFTDAEVGKFCTMLIVDIININQSMRE